MTASTERPPARPLQTFKGVSRLPDASDELGATWNGQKSAKTFHVFLNETTEPVDLCWFYDKVEKYRGTIEPGSNLYVGTYTFHQWKVKSKSGAMLGVHAGQSAVVTVRPSGCIITFNTATVDADGKEATSIATPKGVYALRSSTMGIPVWAFDCVSDAAVARAVHVASCMLQGCPPPVLQLMMRHRPSLAVFGRDHVVTDVPPHSFMRYNVSRDLDRTSRGLGGTPTVPVTSCGEENLLMEGDKSYSSQSILVHELGHCVQNLGMTREQRAAVQAAYEAAVREALYPPSCYMLTNDHEYWAVGTEAWFESTIRTDINGGVNSRERLRRHDPRLAAVMLEVWGDGDWRYTKDCPHPLSFRRRSSTPSNTAAPATLPPSLPPALPPSLPPTLPPSLPPALPPSLPSALPAAGAGAGGGPGGALLTVGTASTPAADALGSSLASSQQQGSSPGGAPPPMHPPGGVAKQSMQRGAGPHSPGPACPQGFPSAATALDSPADTSPGGPWPPPEQPAQQQGPLTATSSGSLGQAVERDGDGPLSHPLLPGQRSYKRRLLGGVGCSCCLAWEPVGGGPGEGGPGCQLLSGSGLRGAAPWAISRAMMCMPVCGGVLGGCMRARGPKAKQSV